MACFSIYDKEYHKIIPIKTRNTAVKRILSTKKQTDLYRFGNYIKNYVTVFYLKKVYNLSRYNF